MSLHDYECPACGHVLVDHNVPIAIGAMKGAPMCPQCQSRARRTGEGLALSMKWIPQVGRMDAYEPFQEYLVHDGTGKQVLVESMAQMRRIERESEQQARNGEGQQMAWRAYSNDVSQTHDHLFTKDTSRAMDHDLEGVGADTEIKLGGRGHRVRQGPIPFNTEGKTMRGEKMTKQVGAPVTRAHGTVD